MQRLIKHSQAKFVCVNVRIIVRNPLYLPNIPMLTPYLTTLIKIRVCIRMNICSLKVTVHQLEDNSKIAIQNAHRGAIFVSVIRRIIVRIVFVHIA